MEQDGAYWVRTIHGVAGVAQSPRLRVSTRGHVVLRGSSGDRITYQLTERVRAVSEVEARSILGGVRAIASQLPGLTTLMAALNADENAITELEINVPRWVAATILETQLGDIEAYGLQGNLQADTTAGLIHCDGIGGGVVARTGGGELHLGKIGGPVRCLSRAGSIFVDNVAGEANCQTGGGEIVVREAGGPLVLSTEGGNIQVDRAASSVEAHSAGGIIEVIQAGGAVFADTQGGSIQVGSARGVRCESAAGAIRVKTSSSPLHLSTVMGSILAELIAGTHLDDASLVAGAGDVTVLIPSNLALSVVARNDSGGNPRIVSDFAAVRSRNIGFTAPPLVAEGAINGGGPVLRINVEGGTIYLRRLK